MSNSPYGPHRRFVAAAEGSTELWRIPVVFVGTYFGGVLLGQILLDSVVQLLAPDVYNAFRGGSFSPNPAYTLSQLALFAAFAAGFVASARLLHERGLWSMIGHLHDAFQDFRAVLLWVGGLYLFVTILGPSPDLPLLRGEISAISWVLLLPLTFAALLIQTGTEEIVFRGYLQQQLGARFSSPLVWLVAPAIFFGLLHWFNQPGPNAWIIVFLITLSALAYGDLTARTGNLGAAWALHFVNNFFAVAVTAVNDDLSGLALYTFDVDWSVPLPTSAVLIEAGLIFCGWLAARVAIRA
ncbi:MAG: CPBP family intramembrane glutamic endopeptidase [Pseudomonadota bacterium]